jgi:hypothetical protein
MLRTLVDVFHLPNAIAFYFPMFIRTPVAFSYAVNALCTASMSRGDCRTIVISSAYAPEVAFVSRPPIFKPGNVWCSMRTSGSTQMAYSIMLRGQPWRTAHCIGKRRDIFPFILIAEVAFLYIFLIFCRNRSLKP